MSRETKQIKLKNIFLATKNPRFANKIDYDQINGDFFRSEQNNNDIENMHNLLEYEGNFDILLELFKSISENYNEMLEKPYLINSKDDDKKIVIEGNRRIMVLKCLNSLIDFSNFQDKFHLNSNAPDEFVTDYNNEEENIDEEKKEKNIKKIKEIIKNYSKNNKEIDISAEQILKDNLEKKEISIAIFSNHVTGDKKGKRNWNRGRTLDMYINFWETVKAENEKDKIQKISDLLNRNEKDVERNLFSASLIIFLIKNSGAKRETFFKKVKISSLEIQFIKQFINFGNESRWKEKIEYKKNIDFKTMIFEGKNKNPNKEKLSKFIIESLKNKFFNTRGVNEDKKREILNKLSIFFGESQDIKEEDFKLPINELGEKNIDYLLENKDKFNEGVKSYLNFIDKNNEFIKNNEFKINYDSPWNKDEKLKPFKKVMNNLFKQYLTLSSKSEKTKFEDYPINGIMSTLRAIIENFSYILMYNDQLLENFKKSKEIEGIKKNGREIKKDLSAENFDSENFDSLFNNKDISNLNKVNLFLRNQFKIYNKSIEKKVISAIQEIWNNKSIEEITNFQSIFDHKIYSESSKIIHSPHLLYIENNNSEIKIFKKNEKFLDSLRFLFQELKIISPNNK